MDHTRTNAPLTVAANTARATTTVSSAKRQKKKAKKALAKARTTAQMAAWSTRCQDCSCSLDAYGAMYHHSGMGPVCEDCIEANDVYDGLKWEAKADIWDLRH